MLINSLLDFPLYWMHLAVVWDLVQKSILSTCLFIIISLNSRLENFTNEMMGTFAGAYNDRTPSISRRADSVIATLSTYKRILKPPLS